MGRALSVYSKPIISTAEPQWRNIASSCRSSFRAIRPADCCFGSHTCCVGYRVKHPVKSRYLELFLGGGLWQVVRWGLATTLPQAKGANNQAATQQEQRRRFGRLRLCQDLPLPR